MAVANKSTKIMEVHPASSFGEEHAVGLMKGSNASVSLEILRRPRNHQKWGSALRESSCTGSRPGRLTMAILKLLVLLHPNLIFDVGPTACFAFSLQTIFVRKLHKQQHMNESKHKLLLFPDPAKAHRHMQFSRINSNVDENIFLPTPKLQAAARRRLLEGTGRPSNPGWRSGRLNKLTEWADSDEANRPIVCEYEPGGLWLWLKWKGTVLKVTLRSMVLAMTTGLLLDYWIRRTTTGVTWPLLGVPPSSEPLIQSLAGLKILWEYQLTVTTFILTFFLSHAYGYWQKVYDTTRKIQGRINDFCMLLVVGAKRGTSSANSNGSANEEHAMQASRRNGYSPESQTLVEACTRLIRLSHTFFWAATPTASNGLTDSEEFIKDALKCPLPIDDEHIGPLLLSSYGLKALVASGQLTKSEAEDLINSELPPTQYAYTLLVWVGLHCMHGLESGTLRGGNGFEENLLRQLTTLRASMFDIDDFRAGRMPLAYVQLVQVMVDSLMMLSPFALYAELGSLCIPLVGLLTLFFRGLLKLSKSFLDPFGVEGFGEQNIRVDVLVSELNFGAGKRWLRAGGSPRGQRRLVFG